MEPIYLDYNATTPLLPEVVEAMLPFLREHFGNPSSGHVFGRRAKEAVARAREQVAELLGCDADEVLFTSGGTESNNLAIFGLTRDRAAGAIVTSVIEHPATSGPVGALEGHGSRVERLGVDPRGVVRLPANVPQGALVTVMHSNNETGVLQPIGELATLAHRAGGLAHTDASQSVGKVPVDVRALDVDALTVCGHKLYAPKGVGALYVRRGLDLRPFMLGASHERGLRPGTENVASIVGLGVAAELASKTLDDEARRVSTLRDALREALSAGIPGLVVNGDGAPRLPNTLSVRLPRVVGSAVLAAAPAIAASTGSACHDGHEIASAVILAMGVAPDDATGTVRLSLGRLTTAQDVSRAAEALTAGWRALTSRG
ncbi:MAG: cysteine desulfurase [Myxococcaceae bacterium]|nr:cysteine desulfurase [Myxococcaceae bacterium]